VDHNLDSFRLRYVTTDTPDALVGDRHIFGTCYFWIFYLASTAPGEGSVQALAPRSIWGVALTVEAQAGPWAVR
jgi:hypothetical protein